MLYGVTVSTHSILSIVSQCSRAQSLGNHEFDLNVDGLLPYLHASSFPHIAANLDLTAEPRLAAESNLRRSVVLPLNGSNNTVGIVGYLTPDTKWLAPQNAVGITDVVVAVK